MVELRFHDNHKKLCVLTHFSLIFSSDSFFELFSFLCFQNTSCNKAIFFSAWKCFYQTNVLSNPTWINPWMKFPQSHISVNPQNPRNNSFHKLIGPLKASCIVALFLCPPASRSPARLCSVSAIAYHSPVISQFRAPTRFGSRLCKMWMELCADDDDDLEARTGTNLVTCTRKTIKILLLKELCWDELPTSITIKRLRGPWRPDTFFCVVQGRKSYSNSSGKS